MLHCNYGSFCRRAFHVKHTSILTLFLVEWRHYAIVLANFEVDLLLDVGRDGPLWNNDAHTYNRKNNSSIFFLSVYRYAIPLIPFVLVLGLMTGLHKL